MSSNEAEEARGELVRLLNEARQRQHLSVRGAAAAAGVPTATVQGWLSGRHLPTPALRDSFERLVDRLGLTDQIPNEWWVDSRYSRAPHLPEDAPYLGLRPYSEADRALFFGRERAIAELAGAVVRAAEGEAPRAIVLVGPSGSGKSSLLAAGLSLAMADGQPLAGFQLHEGHAVLAGGPDDDARTSRDVVVLDQLEDVFQLPGEERAAFFARAGELARRATVVFGLRADAFAEASLEPALSQALSRPVLLSPLTGAELREAVTAPALSRGVRVDDDLVTVLLGELAPGPAAGAIPPGALPLVSTALLVTWAAGSGDRMTLEDYQSTGGVASAVERQAEGVFESLDAQQQLAEQLFLRLVSVEADSVSRSTLPLTLLEPAARMVVDAFTDARILTLTDGDVRISHEALLRHWPRLVGWIEGSRGDLFVLEQLKRAAQLWVDNGRDPESLIPLKRLPMFQELMAEREGGPLLTADERAFVGASGEHFASVLEKEKQTSTTLRRRGRLATGLALVAGTLALATTVMFTQAQSATRVAETAESAAQSRQAALAAQRAAAQDPNLQRRLALVADSLSSTREARSALGDATAVYAPTRWAGEGRSRIAVSPDGELVVRAGVGKITLWRGAELTASPGTTVTIDPEGGAMTGVSLAAAGGRTLLALSGANVAGIWDVTAEPALLQAREGGGWTSAELSPDGRIAAFGHEEGRIELVRLDDPGHPAAGPVIQTPQDAGTEPVSVLSLQFDGTGTLYAGGRGYTIWRWALGSAEPRALTPLKYASERAVLDMAISPSGDQLAAGTYGRKAFRWRLGSGDPSPLKTLTPFVSNVLGVAFTRDGTKLLAAGDDHGTYSFVAATGALISKLPGPNPVQSIGVVADGRIVTADTAGDLRVWPLADPVLRKGNSGYCFASDPSGRWLALGTAFDGLNLWDTRDGQFQRMPDPPVTFPTIPGTIQEQMAAGVGIDPKGRFLLGGTTEGHVVRWPLSDAGAGKPQVLDALPGQYVGFIAMSRDGSLVAASAVNSGTAVVLFTVDEAGQLTKAATIPARTPEAVAISADGTLLAFPNVANEVELWSLADPSAPVKIGSVPTDAQPVIVTFSPVSATLGIGTMSGEVSLWNVTDIASPVVLSRYRDARAEVYGLTFSPDGTAVLGSGGDERVFHWDATQPNSPAVATYDGQFGRTNDVAFVHGGTQFVATGDNGEVRSFTFGREAARRYLCESQGTSLTADEWSRYLTGIPQRDPCEGVR